MLQFSNYIDKEIAEYYLSCKNQNNISHVYVGHYSENTDQKSYSDYNLYSVRPDLVNNTTLMTSFHTHLSRFNDYDRLRPSDEDLKSKANDMGFGVQKFIIVTNPENIEY